MLIVEEEVTPQTDRLDTLFKYIDVYEKDPNPHDAYDAYSEYGIAILEGYEPDQSVTLKLINMYHHAVAQTLDEAVRLYLRAKELSCQCGRTDFKGQAGVFGYKLHNLAGASWTLRYINEQLPRDRNQREEAIRLEALYQETLAARALLADYLDRVEATQLMLEGATLYSNLRAMAASIPDDPYWWHLQIGETVYDVDAVNY